MVSSTLESTKEQALRLDSAALARELVASLDGESDDNALESWESEILRRLRQIDLGQAEFLSVDELRAQFRARLDSR